LLRQPGLAAARSAGITVKLTRLRHIAKVAGPAITLFATLHSTQQAIAGEGPLAARLEGEPLSVKIVNRIGYDTLFGEEVERYVFPVVTGWMDWLAEQLGMSNNRQGHKRNGVLILRTVISSGKVQSYATG
jgi:hypothetical protein